MKELFGSNQNGLNSNTFGKNTVDFTSGNYVDPEEEKEEQKQNTEETLAFSETGPWLICEIKTQGLVNINKKTILKNISAKQEYYNALWQPGWEGSLRGNGYIVYVWLSPFTVHLTLL